MNKTGYRLISTKVIIIILITFSILGNKTIKADNAKNLPKTEILGNEYYIYEVKKDESVYGIAKKYGWDIQELMRLNPEVSSSLKKGERIYYPTGKVSVVTEIPQPVEIDFDSVTPIGHKVKKGETIYSISRQYNVPLDIIYQYNPSSKKGVKAGEIIEIPQNGNSQYYFYIIKKDDTLSSIARNYNTSVEDILKNNAGLTANNLIPGETIRISINSNVGKIKTEMVEEDQITQISSYKVSKNESWDQISEKTGVEVEVLKEANNTGREPKENTLINVPIIEKVETVKTTVFEQPEEMTTEEIQEIYDSIKGLAPDERIFESVRLALVMDEPTSKKDIDFTRGMLLGISEFKNTDYKIDFKVIDGRVSTNDLINELDNFEPNLIISTADKAFPLFLADYGNTNNIQIVNVFDLKNDLYEDNPSIVQMLPPSGIFYDKLATRLYQDNRRRKLLMVGEEDENDGLGIELFKLFGENVDKMSLEEFGVLEPDLFQPIIIYSFATKKEEVDDFLKNMENLIDNHIDLDYKLVGRSNWIALTDEYGDQFGEYSVYIPSRVWIDEEASAWKSFNEEYEEMFNGVPIRSIPSFAASGYDIAKYFIPLIAYNNGDFNKTTENLYEEGLQNNINLIRINNWSGFINDSGYLIRFTPNGISEKIVVN